VAPAFFLRFRFRHVWHDGRRNTGSLAPQQPFAGFLTTLLCEGDRTRILYPGYDGQLPQRTIVNKRPQRTDPGQRHTCQACAPSPIEKKMISARPMMFSNGT
jgi:hypothetical protein